MNLFFKGELNRKGIRILHSSRVFSASKIFCGIHGLLGRIGSSVELVWVYTCFVQASHSGWVKPMFTTLIGNKLDLGLSREYGLKALINTHYRITAPN